MPKKSRSAELFKAAERGEISQLESLIKSGADIYVTNSKHETLLHIAARYGHGDIVDFLISIGLAVNAKCTLGGTPLHSASGTSVRCIKSLLEAGADIQAKTTHGYTALNFAVFNGRLDCLSYLGEPKDSPVHDIDECERTLVHWAANNGSIDCLSYLINKGVDIRQRDAEGITAFLLAVKSGSVDCLSVLVKNNADIDDRDNYGWTALHYAADKVTTINPNILCLTYLFNLAVDPFVKNNSGRTALDLIMNKHRWSVSLISEYMHKTEEARLNGTICVPDAEPCFEF